MSSPLLDIKNLRTYFYTRAGVVKAVDNISLTINKGEVIGIVGESGSGKSVMGFSIMGLVDHPGKIAGGSIKFKGRELTGQTESQWRSFRGKEVAMIFQDPMMTLNPVLRIDTQMMEAIRAHERVSRKTARDRSVRALAQVGIPSPEERIKAYPHQFSGGMRQRVAIATGLLNNPGLIIADEPTTALDVTIQAQILELLNSLRKDIISSILLITHDLGVVAETCDRVGVMYAGNVCEVADVKELFRTPKHPYTAALLDSVPKRAQTDELKTIDGSVPNLVDPPSGCRFHPRCHLAMDICKKETPEVLDTGNNHLVACYAVNKTN